MTSEERKEIRYQNRKKKREEKYRLLYDSLPSYTELFTYKNLHDGFQICKNGVLWKDSIQKYQANLLVKLIDLYTRLMERIYRSGGFVNFTIDERGKRRHIKSVNIDERIVQRVLCDKYLVPVLSHSLIYDNGATIKNKGTDFTLRRLKEHLNSYYRERCSNEGFIILFDFSDYFNSIDHDILFEIIDKKIYDDEIRDLIHHFIDNFTDTGLGLGSQVSQICAVAYPDKLDHYFKDTLGIKCYGRYMDDGYMIVEDKAKAETLVSILFAVSKQLKLQLNPKKVHICKLTNTFTFLKKRITLKENGKIVVKLSGESLRRERHRLKGLKRLLDNGKLSFKDIEQSYKSWRGWASKFNNFKAMQSMDLLFNELFGGNRKV